MGCLEGVPDVLGMDVEHEAGLPSRLFIPSQPHKLASLVFELPGWPKAIHKPGEQIVAWFWRS